ncbi:hypothetical protein ANANG_G00182350, partial [Anguilla anguilla]
MDQRTQGGSASRPRPPAAPPGSGRRREWAGRRKRRSETRREREPPEAGGGAGAAARRRRRPAAVLHQGDQLLGGQRQAEDRPAGQAHEEAAQDPGELRVPARHPDLRQAGAGRRAGLPRGG